MRVKVKDGFYFFSVYLILEIGFLSIKNVECVCNWPSPFVSQSWRDSGKGDMFFTISGMTGWWIWTTADKSTTQNEWTCVANTFETDGRLIMISSQSFMSFGQNQYAYLCITLSKITDNSYRYYINYGESILHSQRLFIYSVSSLTGVDTLCSDTNGAQGSEYQMWIKIGSESAAKIGCPWSFLGRYRYSHTTSSNVQTCDITTSEVSTCSDNTEITFDYTVCSTKVAYSMNDTVWCVSNVMDSGYNFLTVYNGNDADADIDNANTYRFTCFAIFLNASQASVSPQHCQKDQTPYQIPQTNENLNVGALLDFSSPLETCPTCPELTDPDRGTVTIETSGQTTTGTYTCDSPYTLIGASTRNCQSDDTWSGSAPFCSCARPSSPSNGALTTNTEGTLATYTCNVGYTINGPSTRTCNIATTLFDGTDPTCELCDSIPALSGRTSIMSRVSSDTVTVAAFTCTSGTTLTGSTPVTCQSDGTWDTAFPTCADCGSLNNPLSGSVTVTTSGEVSTASYACATGYTRVGVQTRTCQTDGNWDGDAPTCQCNSPPTPSNGDVVANSTTAVYTCSVNYTLSGDTVRSCGADGSGWSGSEPTCVMCTAIDTVETGTVTLVTSGTMTTAKYTCNLGYSLDGSSTITCQSSGAWNTLQSDCVECPALSDPPSGTASLSTSGTKTSVTYVCASGYNLNGNAIRLCDSNGVWSLTEPTCTCQAPSELGNGVMASDGTTVSYICNLSYSLNGARTRTCGADGSGWTGSDPSCVLCSGMFAPSGGTINFSTDNYNTLATFTCNLGYTLNGVTPITCNSDGTWTAAQPTCANCSTLSAPASGDVSVTSENNVTTVATFSCVSGYYLSGSFQLTCQADATWSSPDPTCKCNFPPTPSNGGVSVSDSSTGTLASYTCSEGYTLNGLSTRECLSDGTGWEGSDPLCAVCAAVSLVTDGEFALSTNQTHTRVAFTCNVGTTLNGVSEASCLSDGTWDNTQPTCVTCSTLTNPESGTVAIATNGLVTTTTYTCASGYELTSSGTLSCQTDGTWDITPPSCICTAASAAVNGQVTISSGNSVATFSCDSGYVLVGSAVRYCQTDGTGWNGTQPTCELTATAAASTDKTNSDFWSLHIGIVISLIILVFLLILLFIAALIKYCYLRKEVKIAHKPLGGRVLMVSENTMLSEDGSRITPMTLHDELPSKPDVALVSSRPQTSKSLRFAEGTKDHDSGYSSRPESKASTADVLILNGHAPLTSKSPDNHKRPGTPGSGLPPFPPTSHQFKSSGQKKKSPSKSPLKSSPKKGSNSVKRLVSPKRRKTGGGARPMTPIEQRMAEIGVGRIKTPDLLSSAPFEYINPVFCYEAETPLPDINTKSDQCPTLSNPAGGAVTFMSDGQTTTANYSCSAGYSLSADDGFLTCQQDQTWDLAIPTCQQCESLNTFTSITVTMATDGHVTTALFTCVSGYNKVGADSRTCLSDGTWDSTNPVCKCNNPPVLQNGAVIANGETANYTCSVGLTLSGSAIRTCLNDGSGWSGADPSCVLCPTLNTPTGGQIATSTSGTVTSATFTCNGGYTLSGQNTVACLSSGSWETLPSCVECNQLQSPSSGSYTVTTSDSVSMVTYTCATGYDMSGDATRTCTTDGSWTGTAPTCNCQSPAQPSNGQATDDGQTATYTCQTGYSLSGQSVRTCSLDATGWGGTDPSCVSCPALSDINGGSFTQSTDGLKTTVSYTCDSGYTLNGVTSMTCDSTGVWNATVPECVSCPTITDPSSGSVTLTTDGSTTTATVACATGYYVNGVSSFDCLTTGQWALTSPTCKCNLPAQPADGSVSVSDTSEGQMASYTCDTGHTLFGLSSRQCLEDGTGWQGVDPTCSSCTIPSTPAETSTVLSFDGVVTMISFTCAQNYTLSGTSVQICQSDGTWNDDIPTCNMCSTISSLNGGTVSLTTDGVFTSVMYTCNNGYTLSGMASLTCLTDGSWNGTEPTCVLCPSLSSPASGSVSTSTDGYTTTATFTCATGYYLSGSSTLNCQTTGLWDGNSPTCECDFPASPTNGDVSVKDGSDGTTAEYTCTNEYTLSGPPIRVCANDGTGWSGTEPTCVQCNLATLPSETTAVFTTNGTITTVTYTCVQNYTLSGTSVQICQSDGTWSGQVPTCVNCPDLSDINGGSFTQSTDGLKTTVSYTCDSGYTLNGVTSMTCDSTGVWNATAPECVSCSTLMDPSSGSVTLTTDEYTTTATFVCATGYYVEGVSSFNCLTSGQWAEASPTCKCNLPAQPADGSVSVSDTSGGQMAYYTCDTGHTLFGLSSRQCMEDGTGWQGADPTCTVCTLPTITSEMSTELSTNGAVTTVTFTCAQNYSLSGTNVQTCQTDGTWTDDVPTCNMCSTITSLNSGTVSLTTNGVFTSVTYICSDGYTLSGMRSLTCLTDGSWNGTVPTCECDFPASPTNGDVSVKDGSGGTTAEYTCTNEYTLSGPPIRVCASDGTGWSGIEPTCAQCNVATLPSETTAVFTTNGTITTVTYTCVQNYTLSGTSVQICQSDGTWSGEVPTCVNCPDLSDINGGSFTQSTDGLKSTVSYTCDSGYTLNGETSITCDSTGVWNATVPECVSCPSLTDPSSGSVTLTTDQYTTAATFSCATGYYVEGVSSFNCLKSGQWAEASPTCKCNLPAQPADGSVSVSDTSEGQMAYYKCDTGYTLSGLSSRQCMEDGTGWQGADPTCTVCTLPTTPSEMSTELSTNDAVTTVTYTCAQNYTLSGTNVQTCQTDGTWTDDTPTCNICSPIASLNGGTVYLTTDGEFTSVTFTCTDGYTLSGMRFLTCLTDGSWNGTEPTCVSCPSLTSPASGLVSTSTDGYTTTATFTCATGYYLSGSSTLNCQTTGLWGGDSPMCECNFPDNPTNGDVSVKDSAEGTVAVFACNLYYTLSDSPTRLCASDGTGWSGIEPTCVQCNLATLPSDTTAVFTTNGTITTVTYTCVQNYTLSGTSVQICQSDGTWSGQVPTCVLCSSTGVPEGASVSSDTDGLETTLSYTCGVGYTIKGLKSLTCTATGTLNGTAPTCVACPALTGPMNGAVFTSTDGFVTAAEFTCVSAYYLSGPSFLNCQTTGQWDGDPPICECNFPTSPTNGDVSVRDTAGEIIAEYSCNNNYTLSGPHIRLCASDGTGWSGIQPVCVECTLPSLAITTLAVVWTNGTITTVTYMCVQNYTLSGTSVQICQSDGTWTGQVPTCVSCPALTNPSSGSVSTSTDGFVTRAEFTCVAGYYLSGSSSLVCQTIGQWDGVQPACECNFPATPTNGDVFVKDTSEGTVAAYTCATNYTLSGTASRLCHDDGRGWAGVEPNCVLCSPLSPTLPLSDAISSSGIVTSVAYTCSVNYTLVGASEQTCLSDGTWTGALPSCIMCPEFEAPDGGTVVTETDGLVTTVSYACDDGYTLYGLHSLSCKPNGTLSGPVPTCVSCPPIASPSSGSVSTLTDGFVTRAEFVCVTGYYLSGSSSLSCLTTGQWGGVLPSCECNFPASPTNGDVFVQDTSAGTVAAYTCDTNYTLSGSASRLCQDNGMGWAGTEPTCVLCSPISPVSPLSATFASSGTVTSVSYACAVNYTLIGTSVQTCMSNSSWSSTPPTCEPCDAKSQIDSGSVAFTTNGSVTLATFTCAAGYSLNSTGTATCLNNGTWDQIDPVCVCDPPAGPSNGVVQLSETGRRANYSCASQYTLVGSAVRFCLNDGTGWNGTEPTCGATAASPAASTEDTSTLPIHISLFIILIIVIAILLALVVFCAYRRFKTEKKPSKIGASNDDSTAVEAVEREKSFGSDKISKEVEEGKAFLIAKQTGKKLTFDVRNLTPTPPNEVPNIKFDSERPTVLKIRKNASNKPPPLPPRPTEPSSTVPLSSVRLPKLKSRAPDKQDVPQRKKGKRKKPTQPPTEESLINGTSDSSNTTPIDISFKSRGNTPDLLSTAEFNYIQPVYCHEVQTPESTPSKTPVPSPSKTPVPAPSKTPVPSPSKTPVQTPSKTPVSTPSKTRPGSAKGRPLPSKGGVTDTSKQNGKVTSGGATS